MWTFKKCGDRNYDMDDVCCACGKTASSRSPACSIAEPLFVSLYPMQRTKIEQFVVDGALITECLVTLHVPHCGVCTVDRHGRVVWSN